MTVRYSPVIFDLDGTLMASAAGVLNALRHTMERMGIPPASAPSDLRPFLGPPLRCGLQTLLGLEGAELDAAVGHYREYYREIGLFEAECYPGVGDLLQDLRRAGAQVCLATSKYSVMAERMLEHFGLRSLIGYMAMSAGGERQSAKKEMLLDVLAACGKRPDAAVMIGDTHYDAEGALAVGMPFIGVLYGYGTREEMEKAGGSVFAADVPELKKLLFSRARHQCHVTPVLS